MELSDLFNGKQILVIDDSAAIRNYMRAVLSRQGASVNVAGSGQEGLDTLSRGKYDLVLLDLLLPDTTGIEVLQHIRQKDDETTIVILTGTGGVKSAIAAVRSGADAYIEKQDVVTSGDIGAFFYTLEQALKYRAGLVAQKYLQEIKTDFYSMITHDLRNPATCIAAATQMLHTMAGSLAPEQVQLVELIERSTRKMLTLVNDYLDFAKIEAGYLQLNLGDVELRGVAEASTQLARLQAQARSQLLVLDLPPEPVPARADAERIEQVLDNLLSNAIKYTPPGGRITLQLRAENGRAVFRVSDTGHGIPAAQLPVLFTKYHRVPGETTRLTRGTGLGLLIVKEITEAHGGAVAVESEGVPGKGTTFTVSIPLEPATE